MMPPSSSPLGRSFSRAGRPLRGNRPWEVRAASAPRPSRKAPLFASPSPRREAGRGADFTLSRPAGRPPSQEGGTGGVGASGGVSSGATPLRSSPRASNRLSQPSPTLGAARSSREGSRARGASEARDRPVDTGSLRQPSRRESRDLFLGEGAGSGWAEDGGGEEGMGSASRREDEHSFGGAGLTVEAYMAKKRQTKVKGYGNSTAHGTALVRRVERAGFYEGVLEGLGHRSWRGSPIASALPPKAFRYVCRRRLHVSVGSNSLCLRVEAVRVLCGSISREQCDNTKS